MMAHAYRDQRSTSGVVHQEPPHCSLRQGLSLGPGACSLGWLTIEPHSFLLGAGITGMHYAWLLSVWFLRQGLTILGSVASTQWWSCLCPWMLGIKVSAYTQHLLGVLHGVWWGGVTHVLRLVMQALPDWTSPQPSSPLLTKPLTILGTHPPDHIYPTTLTSQRPHLQTPSTQESEC